MPDGAPPDGDWGRVAVGSGVSVGSMVGKDVADAVAVDDGVAVGVAVSVGEGDGVRVDVGRAVGVAVGKTAAWAMFATAGVRVDVGVSLTVGAATAPARYAAANSRVRFRYVSP